LESYVNNLRNTLRKLEDAVNETANLLDPSKKASKEEYEEKKAELETIAGYVCFIFFLLIPCPIIIHIDSTLLQAVHLAVCLVVLVALVGKPCGFP
jgi:tetrahydromethanopterin S-methyltransferase subunit B